MNKCLVCIENEQLRKCYLACLKKAHRLDLENEELKQKVSFYKDFQKDARELEAKNECLEQMIGLVIVNELNDLSKESVTHMSDEDFEMIKKLFKKYYEIGR